MKHSSVGHKHPSQMQSIKPKSPQTTARNGFQCAYEANECHSFPRPHQPTSSSPPPSLPLPPFDENPNTSGALPNQRLRRGVPLLPRPSQARPRRPLAPNHRHPTSHSPPPAGINPPSLLTGVAPPSLRTARLAIGPGRRAASGAAGHISRPPPPPPAPETVGA